MKLFALAKNMFPIVKDKSMSPFKLMSFSKNNEKQQKPWNKENKRSALILYSYKTQRKRHNKILLRFVSF